MAAYLWDIVTDSLQPTTATSPPSFITSNKSNNQSVPTPLENKIKNIIISAYSSNIKSPPHDSTSSRDPSLMTTSTDQSDIYSAEDTPTTITSPLLFPAIKPHPSTGAGTALSTVQGQPDNVPLKRGGDQRTSSTSTNLSDIDKQLMYSPIDTPLMTTTVQSTNNDTLLLSNAFSLRSTQSLNKEEEEEGEGSVCSEPVGNERSHSLTTPTPSLPGNLTLKMPAHLRTSRPLLLSSSSTRLSPSPSLQTNSSCSTPIGEEMSHDKPLMSHDLSYRSHDPSHSFPINAQGSVSELRNQLRHLMSEKAHLEGQLESVIEECQTTLTERAQLQSKLAQTEVQLTSLKVNTSDQKSKHVNAPSDEDEQGTDLQIEINRLESTLSSKRRELVDKNKLIETEKQKVKQLTDQLELTQKLSDERQKQISEDQLISSNLEAKIEEREDTIEELKGQLSSLQATVNSNESSKNWLRQQLQDTIDSKTKLHEEMRSLRSTNLAQNIKLDTLAKEKDLYQEQIIELQKGILNDKAKLVSELEAIEEDVLSKEGSYVQVLAEKEQFEKELNLKSNQLDALTTSLADQKALNVELSNQLNDTSVSRESLSDQIKSLTDERNQLSDQVRLYGQQLSLKEQENKELKRTKTNLHQRLQQAETNLVTSEGSLQSIKESTNVLQHELKSLEQVKNNVEKELNNVQADNMRLESQLEASENNCQQLENELIEEKRKYTQAEKKVGELEAELSRKQDEIIEKDKTLDELQNQSGELQNHFRSLQQKFEDIASQSETGIQQKENIISSLVQDKQTNEQQICELIEKEKELKNQIDTLKETNACLEGELETAQNSGPQLDDFRRVLKEKNDLDSKLVSERLGHQQELIKTQAKVARLDTELKDTRKESKKREGMLSKELDSAQKIINDLTAQLEEIKNTPVIDTQPSRDEVDGLQGALQERDDFIKSLQQDCLVYQDENNKLKDELMNEQEHCKHIEEKLQENIRKLQETSARDKDQYENEKHELIVETQHLKGRLAGISRSQQCTREHANSLEKSIAQKESQLQQLSAENDRILTQKDENILELETAVSELKDKENVLKSELEQVLNDSLLNKQKYNEMERHLEALKVELEQFKRDSLTVNNVKDLEEQIDMLENVKTDLQSEVRVLKQQLTINQSTTQTIEQELQEKTQVIQLLEQNLKLTKDQLEETQNELETLQLHLLNQKHSSPRNWPHLSSSTPQFIDGSLSPVIVKTSESLIDDMHRDEDSVAREKSKEISDLRSQLGTKSMTLKNLHSCLRDLKNDMGHIQNKMGNHSHSLQSSYKSSQKLEDRIKMLQLSRSSSGGGEGGGVS